MKKTLLLDHIAESYHLLCSKYQRSLIFILAGETNDLKLDSILNLSPNIKQLATTTTGMNPPRILDHIITNASTVKEELADECGIEKEYAKSFVGLVNIPLVNLNVTPDL